MVPGPATYHTKVGFDSIKNNRTHGKHRPFLLENKKTLLYPIVVYEKQKKQKEIISKLYSQLINSMKGEMKELKQGI